MTVSIKGHTYEMGRKEFNKYIKSIKNMIGKKKVIIAIEKDGHVEMRNDEFKTQADLTAAIQRWNAKGFKVNYSRGI